MKHKKILQLIDGLELTPEQRDVLLFRYSDEARVMNKGKVPSYEDIRRMMGYGSKDTVRYHLTNARGRMAPSLRSKFE